MQYIVTVKLDRNLNHDPRNKKTSSCPVSPTCTDATGEHHSFLIDAANVEEVRERSQVYHITRIEEV
jgi:hypothetical protein